MTAWRPTYSRRESRSARRTCKCRWGCKCALLAVVLPDGLVRSGEIFDDRASLRPEIHLDWTPRLSRRQVRRLAEAFTSRDWDAYAGWFYPDGIRMDYWRKPLLCWSEVLAILRRHGVRHVSGRVGVWSIDLEEPSGWTDFSGELPSALSRAL